MSTTTADSFVKQSLVLKLDRLAEQLRGLAESLPDDLDDLAAAEQQIREGVLEIGRQLLQSWSDVADAQAATPECDACEEPMRHKGYVVGPLMTTLGPIRVRRPRFRCECCGLELYPHDQRLRFHKHSVSWPLAKVLGRLGAQLPFAQAQRSLEQDYHVHVSKSLLQTVCDCWQQRIKSASGCNRCLSRSNSRRCPTARLCRKKPMFSPMGP